MSARAFSVLIRFGLRRWMSMLRLRCCAGGQPDGMSPYSPSYGTSVVRIDPVHGPV